MSPCDGITVLQAQIDAENLIDEIVWALGRQNIRLQSKDKDGGTRIAAVINGTQCQIAISPQGQLTVVTRNGTFETGKDALLGWISGLRSQGVRVDGVKFESHRHDHKAPRLAYSTAQQRGR